MSVIKSITMGLYSAALTFHEDVVHGRASFGQLEATALRFAASRLASTGEAAIRNACLLLEQLAQESETKT